MRQHCVGQLLLFISEKQGTATTKSRSIIYLDYLVLVKRKKKQVDVNLLFVKLYCSSTLNYLQLNYSYSARFWKGAALRFFKNARDVATRFFKNARDVAARFFKNARDVGMRFFKNASKESRRQEAWREGAPKKLRQNPKKLN